MSVRELMQIDIDELVDAQDEDGYIHVDDIICLPSSRYADYVEIGRVLEIIEKMPEDYKGTIFKGDAIRHIKALYVNDCRGCKLFEECECGQKGHKNGTSIGYSVGECEEYTPYENVETISETFEFVSPKTLRELFEETFTVDSASAVVLTDKNGGKKSFISEEKALEIVYDKLLKRSERKTDIGITRVFNEIKTELHDYLKSMSPEES